jgi:hypothetical protein
MEGAVDAAQHIQAADEQEREGASRLQMQLAPECVSFWPADRQHSGSRVYGHAAWIVELLSLRQKTEVQGILSTSS